MNLDPFEVHDDETIWKALKLSKMDHSVTELDGGNRYLNGQALNDMINKVDRC